MDRAPWASGWRLPDHSRAAVGESGHAILSKIEKPLVLSAKGGFFSTNYQYLVSYKGFAFFTKSSEPILLPTAVETIAAKKI